MIVCLYICRCNHVTRMAGQAARGRKCQHPWQIGHNVSGECDMPVRRLAEDEEAAYLLGGNAAVRWQAQELGVPTVVLGEPLYWYICPLGHMDAMTTPGVRGKRCAATGYDHTKGYVDRGWCRNFLTALSPEEEAAWRIGGMEALKAITNKVL